MYPTSEVAVGYANMVAFKSSAVRPLRIASAKMLITSSQCGPIRCAPRMRSGLPSGLALTERPANHTGMLPDRILLFRGPLLDMADTVEDLAEEVRITVVHEVAHHFGIDDARLHDLGYA